MTTASTLSHQAAPPPEPERRGPLVPAADDPRRIDAYLPSPCVQNHAANLALLPNGDLLCAWFGGTQEGIPDVSIHVARLPAGGDRWEAPVKLSDDPGRSEQNPVLFPAPDGTLWLMYTAQISGHQDTAIVRCRVSADQGRSWGPVRTLFEAEGHTGVFIRQPVVVLDNGDWLLPTFLCHGTPGRAWVGDHDTSAVRISSDGGRTWTEHAVSDSTGCVHMNIVPLADGRLAAFYRSRWADHVYRSLSSDGGRSWTAPEPTELPNNNSSIQVTALSDGRLAIVYNHASAADATGRRLGLYDDIEDAGEDAGEGTASAASTAEPAAEPPAEGRTAFWGAPRAPLTLALSSDGGVTWPLRRDLEVGDGYCMTNNSKEKLNREFSYPAILQTPDGRLRIAFTYFRQAIKYTELPPGWVDAGWVESGSGR
ncbi:glycosyl hydrolase (plasmid) [Azospirillum brasilense]|uniref:Glycosyl hydrolase n=1 Tax=Azospirillum brasilense TaxID=192 RepID=A0A4D8RFD3_AZOBR|nr:exo-alpha-sialidase [Azospirillum brasilense]QCO19864.1 glycosyl hydrolase [Azospirillum brasilense]